MLRRALADLYARVPLGMRLGTEAMLGACARAGHPEQAFPCVHIAGTNGKGSVSALVERVAREAGLRTGLYTSPHLARFAERVRLDGAPVSDEALAALLEEALRVGHDLSFFETATLAAFLAFRAARVDLAVLEVGLGGRHDATNVVAAPELRATVITRIALDHTDRLGPDLRSIAREKAGIAKPGVPMVVGRVPPEVRAVIEDVAGGRGAELRFVADEPGIAQGLEGVTHLGGLYQETNAEVALVTCRALGLAAHVPAGFAATRWPGRYEWLRTPAGPWLLDAAHNPDGAAGLVASIARSRAPEHRPARDGWPAEADLRGRALALVFGALADKDYRATLELVASLTETRFYAEPRGRAPAPAAALAQIAPGVPCASIDAALEGARRAVGPEGVVLVCGSISLLGEARALLLQEPMDPPVAL